MSEPFHLGLWILDISKTGMYEFWYDHIKRKYGEKEKLSYMDTGSFIVQARTEYIHRNTVDNVETRFDTSNYETDFGCL